LSQATSKKPLGSVKNTLVLVGRVGLVGFKLSISWPSKLLRKKRSKSDSRGTTELHRMCNVVGKSTIWKMAVSPPADHCHTPTVAIIRNYFTRPAWRLHSSVAGAGQANCAHCTYVYACYNWLPRVPVKSAPASEAFRPHCGCWPGRSGIASFVARTKLLYVEPG